MTKAGEERAVPSQRKGIGAQSDDADPSEMPSRTHPTVVSFVFRFRRWIVTLATGHTASSAPTGGTHTEGGQSLHMGDCALYFVSGIAYTGLSHGTGPPQSSAAGHAVVPQSMPSNCDRFLQAVASAWSGSSATEQWSTTVALESCRTHERHTLTTRPLWRSVASGWTARPSRSPPTPTANCCHGRWTRH